MQWMHNIFGQASGCRLYISHMHPYLDNCCARDADGVQQRSPASIYVNISLWVVYLRETRTERWPCLYIYIYMMRVGILKMTILMHFYECALIRVGHGFNAFLTRVWVYLAHPKAKPFVELRTKGYMFGGVWNIIKGYIVNWMWWYAPRGWNRI